MHTAAREKLTGSILLIGTSSDCADLVYATRFQAPDPVVFHRRGGRGYLVLSPLEYGRAVRTVPEGIEVLTAEALGLRGTAARSVSGWAVAIARKTGARRVTVPVAFPLGAARALEKAGVKVVVAKQPIFPARAVKTADELRCIREAQQAAVIAMRAAVSMISHSTIESTGALRLEHRVLTSERVKRRIAEVLWEHGCVGRDTIVAGGEQGVDPHEQGSGPLRGHEAIVIDIFPQHTGHGYWGDLTRTVLHGKASSSLRQIYHAVNAAQALALSAVRPGVKGSVIHRKVNREFERRGFRRETIDGRPAGFIHGTGHGVGLEIHENPRISLSDECLKSGNVVTIEPGLYYPGKGGVRIEDTVVVTPGGWRYLVPCERKFVV